MKDARNEVSMSIMKDASEIVHYDTTGIPLYIQRDRLSGYPDRRALCHWHDDLEFIRVLEGKMNYYVNGQKVLLKKNDGIVVNTRQMHYGCSAGQADCVFLCILVHPSMLSASKHIYQKYVLPVLENQETGVIYLDSNTAAHAAVLKNLDAIYERKANAEWGYELEIVGLLYTIWKTVFGLMKAQTHREMADHADAGLQKDMVSFIYQHFSEKLTLADIAAAGGVCKSKCCLIFKKYLSQSPIDFLNSYRLEVSSHLLKNTDKSITQIALECGFNHLSYYSELFLRYYGSTPRDFRKTTAAKDWKPVQGKAETALPVKPDKNGRV